MNDLKKTKGIFLGKEETGRGEKNGKQWVKYKLTFNIDGEVRYFTCFGNTKGIDDLEQDKTFDVLYKLNNYNGKTYSNAVSFRPAGEDKPIMNEDKEKEFLTVFDSVFSVAEKDQMKESYFVGAFMRNVMPEHSITKYILEKFKEVNK